MPVLKSAKHEKFAAGIASGLSATQAYIKAGYSKEGARFSAARLLTNANVRARVAELSEKVTKAIVLREIGNRNDRVAAQNERWHLMRQVIKERAEEQLAAKAAGQKIPAGGATGLLVRTAKSLGSGAAAKIVIEYEVDTGLLRELRAHEQHAAQELGQWTEKSDSTVRFPPLRDASEDELKRILSDLGVEEGTYPRSEAGA